MMARNMIFFGGGGTAGSDVLEIWQMELAINFSLQSQSFRGILYWLCLR
jgi:hypothetical protein